MPHVAPRQHYSMIFDHMGSKARRTFRVDRIDGAMAYGVVLETGRDRAIEVRVLKMRSRGSQLVQDEHGNSLNPEEEKRNRKRRPNSRMRAAERLHRVRGYSRLRLAEKFGVTKSTIGMWLRLAAEELKTKG